MADSESGREVARSELRASHEDRDRVVELLRVSAGDGRLTADELDDRLELAMSARTYGELAKIVADLPAAGEVTQAPALATTKAKAKDLVRIDCRSGHVRRAEQWVVPQRIEVKVTSGHVVLDLTRAVLSQPTLDLDLDVRSGHVRLITKPGVIVDTDDIAIRSGHVRVREPWSDQVPVALQINVAGRVGSGHFEVGPPRRTFWQWLTRQPLPYADARR
jgi:hypothetical protein